MKSVGIDLHKKTIVLCVVNQEKKVLQRTRFLCADVERIRAFFAGLGEFQAVVEATASYEWLVAILEPLAKRVVLAHPGKLRVIAESSSTVSLTVGGSGGLSGAGHSRLAVSAVSPTKSRESVHNTGSIRSIRIVRTAEDLTAGKSSPSVNAASAQPRSGSAVARKYSAISRSFSLRLRV